MNDDKSSYGFLLSKQAEYLGLTRKICTNLSGHSLKVMDFPKRIE